MFSYHLFTPTQIFITLGNNRPKILVQLENCVLQAVLDIAQGKSTEDVIGALCSQVESLQEDLGNDNEASNWFNLSSPAFSAPLTPPASDLRPNRLAGKCIQNNFKALFDEFLPHSCPAFSSRILLSSCLLFSSLAPYITGQLEFGALFTVPISPTQQPC